MDEMVAVHRSPSRKARKTWRKNIRYLLRTKLRSYPALEKSLLGFWHPLKFSYWKSRWKFETWLRSLQGERLNYIDGDRIYHVSPQKIVYSSLQEFNLRVFKGHVLAGDWDRLEKRFDDLDITLAIKQVCVEGKHWEDTLFFQSTLADINHGRIHYGCRTAADLVDHCKKIDRLYADIQHHGYRSQKELFADGKLLDPLQADEEVAISIGREGDLLFSDGAHRLAIARLLSLPAIPVKVAVRHAEWIKFRQELALFARDSRTSKDNTLYQPVTHLDLADLPASHESNNRFQLIKDSTSFHKGSLLDIGAYLGYFCHRFEDAGIDCVAIENDPHSVYFLKRLARAENRRFQVYDDSVLENAPIRSIHFNIVLALNIFHHFLKTQSDYDRLVDLLNHLSMDEMYFEAHLPGEIQMDNAYMNYSPEEFVQFILANSMLNDYTLIGRMGDGRPIYKLFRSSLCS